MKAGLFLRFQELELSKFGRERFSDGDDENSIDRIRVCSDGVGDEDVLMVLEHISAFVVLFRGVVVVVWLLTV